MTNKKVAGVASGLADFFGVDIALVRVLFILATIFANGIGVIVYLVCWVAMPSSTAPGRTASSRLSTTIVILAIAALAVIGFVSFAGDYRFSHIGLDSWLPLIIIVGVAVFLWRRIQRRRAKKRDQALRQQRLADHWNEPTAQEAPPTYFGGDAPFHIDSFYPPTPGPGYPPPGQSYPPPVPPYPSPNDPNDPWNNPSGFQQQ